MHGNEYGLAGAVAASPATQRALGRAARIGACVLATAFGAQLAIRLPFTPVPVTMQTIFVVLAGAALGPRDGCYAMLSYLALGLAGAPVFSSLGYGPAALLGPTGGYLAAFPAAALLSGFLASRLRAGRLGLFAASLAGLALILGMGALWLALAPGISLSQAVFLGISPFLAGELLKALLSSLLLGGSMRH